MLFRYSPHTVQVRDRLQEQPVAGSCSLGYGCKHLTNMERLRLNRVARYRLPSHEHGLEGGECAMVGSFLVAHNYIESCEPGAALLIGIRGVRVLNLALRPVGLHAIVQVLCNLQVLGEGVRGRDVAADSTVGVVDELRSYELLASQKPRDGVVGLQVLTGSVRVYSFTFS